MRRPGAVPDELKHGPITIADARAAGLSPSHLRSSSWRRVARGMYVWAGLADPFDSTVRGWHRRLPREAVFSGVTAARIHGLDLGRPGPVEVTMPPGPVRPTSRGLRAYRSALDADDIVKCRGVPVTSTRRTWFDLARRLPIGDAVAAVDWALHVGLLTSQSLEEYAADKPRLRGVPQLRRVIEIADPRTESLMESRLRVLLVEGSLPAPEVQYPITDASGRVTRRLDLCYPGAALGIEYDGDGHRSTLIDDNRRQNWLLDRGFVLLRYTAPDVYRRPHDVVEQVRSHLSRGTSFGRSVPIGSMSSADSADWHRSADF